MMRLPPVIIECDTETETDRLAGCFAACVSPPCVIGLQGTLGAGKTHFVRGVVRALGGSEDDVVSPTYVLCQHYACEGGQIHHLDAYRIQDDDEFLELGVEDLFEEDALAFVEWSERVLPCLPTDLLQVKIEVVDQEVRRFTFQPADPTQAEWMRRLEALFQSKGQD